MEARRGETGGGVPGPMRSTKARPAAIRRRDTPRGELWTQRGSGSVIPDLGIHVSRLSATCVAQLAITTLASAGLPSNSARLAMASTLTK